MHRPITRARARTIMCKGGPFDGLLIDVAGHQPVTMTDRWINKDGTVEETKVTYAPREQLKRAPHPWDAYQVYVPVT